jgi:hypothetical protein
MQALEEAIRILLFDGCGARGQCRHLAPTSVSRHRP